MVVKIGFIDLIFLVKCHRFIKSIEDGKRSFFCFCCCCCGVWNEDQCGITCSLQVIGKTLEAVEATRRGEEKLGSTIINQVC